MNEFRKAADRFFDLVGLRNFFIALGFLAAAFALFLAGVFETRGGASIAGGTAVFSGLCMVAAAVTDRGEKAGEAPKNESAEPASGDKSND